MKKVLLRIMFWFNLLSAALLIVSYLSVYFPPDGVWIISVFGLAYPYFLVVNFFFLFFWILFKPRNFIISLLVILFGFGHLSRYVQISGNTFDKSGINVVSYNVKHFSVNGDKLAKKTADSIIAFLIKKSPDIICLQEVRLRTQRIFDLPKIVRDFQFIHHYQYARTAYDMGMVTMTRYPIVNMGEIRFENSGNMAIFTDIIIHPDTFRVFNVHLQSFQIDPNNYSVIESPGITNESDLREVKEMGSKFKRAFQMRSEQARIIRKNINWSPFPVILCGDFNDTPVSYTYHKVKGELLDAFVESGTGIGRTYIGGKLPSFRIDYIMHSDVFESYNFKPDEFYFSDHLPISCSLVRKN